MASRVGSFVGQVRALVHKNFLDSVLRRPLGFFLCIYGIPIALLTVLASIPSFLASHDKYGISSPKPLAELPDILNKKLVIVKPARLGPDVDRVIKAITEPLDDDLVQIVEDEGVILDLCLANLRGVSPCFASITFSDSPETKGSYFSEAYDDVPSYMSDYDAVPEKYKTKHVWEYIIRVDPARLNSGFDVPKHKTANERTVMPVQVAVNRAITNSTANPKTMVFTDWTQDQEDQQQRETTVQLVGTVLSFTLFAAYFLIIYRQTTLISAEREAGMSQLVDAMGGGSAVFARVLSWLLVFGVSTIPVYVVFGVLYNKILFPSTGLGLIVGWQLLEGLAVNSSTIFAASFFKKSRVSAIYVIGAFFLLSIGTQVFAGSTKPKPQPAGAYLLSLLFASANNVLFTQQMCLWEYDSKAADFSVQPEGNSDVGIQTDPYKVTQSEMLGFLVFQIIIYPVLAIIVEKYMHGIDYRNRKFNGPSSSESHGSVIAATFNYKKHFVPNVLERIFCCGKRKTVKAVNGVSLESHKGQILGLVGPNGSGKTTTLQMMSGFISPSSGSVVFNASPAQIGICPQRNTFWDELTVMEHMKIWSRIKATNMTNVELDKMLVACDLELKRNSKAKTLSGGQKRKLQLACMFVGDSSLCLIDECTSGLDPLSRRAIWEILLAQRAKRSIIFTTHFLDEVDVLADQIVILTKGKVKCQGPAAELKNLHGGGYKVFVPQAAARTLAIEYPAADHQDQVVYSTPDSNSAAALCARLSAAGVVDYSVSGPQVEDVFLNVADDDLILKPQMPSEPLDETDLDSAQTTSFGQQVWVLFRKRLTVLKRFWWPYFYVLLLPLLITPFLKGVIGKYRQPSCANLTPDLYEASATSFYYDEYCSQENYCEHMSFGPKSARKELQDALKQDLYEFNAAGAENATKLIDIRDTYDGFVKAIKEDKNKIYNVGGVYLGSRDQAPLVAFRDSWGSGDGFLMMNMLAQIESEMPILARLGGFAQTRKNADDIGTLYVVFFTLLQALYPAAFVLYPAIERSRRVRSLEYSNGVRRGPLWVAYGLFDAMFVLIIAIGTTAIMSVNLAGIWNGPIFIMLPILFLYGVAAILMGYLVSHFVNGPLKSFLAMAMISLVMFAISTIAFSIGFGYSENGDSVSNGITFGLNIIFPVGNVWRAAVLGFNVLQVACKDGQLLPTASIYAYGGPILYLVIQVIVLLLLIIWLEGDLAFFRRTTPSSIRVVDGEKATGMRSDEVKGEAARVEETESDLLRAIRVDKSFGSNHAVDRVSFGLPQSDVLALIGPNGAGKSTLVNMITSELSCDGGQILLKGEDARTRGAQKYLGVCPQHDALDMMSTRDHLSFYARVKGIRDVKTNVDHVMKRLELTPHANTLATKLSGGNKRKLSLAIALIGKPPVLVLDEPTSAMDAVAKRSFWRIIQEIAPGRSVLLTTHSMEEADTLATRTAIISKKLLAVGTTQALREKYNNVYYVSILLKSAPNSSIEEMERLRVWIQNRIPNSKLEREVMGGQIRFTIPGSDRSGQNAVTEVIQILEREKESVGIEYYSIGGATLERVFLNVVRENNVNEEDGGLSRGERLMRFLRLRR